MTDISPNKLREIEYERPWLYDKQSGAFFTTKRYSYVEASTKAGKTHACIVWITEQAALEGFEGWNGWWVAPTKAQAKIAYTRICNALPKSHYVKNEGELFIQLINGARLWFKSAEKPDNLYGEDVHAAVLDEASRTRYDSFKALRSTLTATGGQLRLIGNVKGKSNWFYMACRGAERGRENALFTRITCYDAVAAGILTQAEIDDARQSGITANDFMELYEARAADDADAFLPSKYVEEAISRGRLPKDHKDKPRPYGQLIIGADPSQGKGDAAAFCFRRGSVVEKVEEHPNMDEFGFKAHCLRLIEVHKPQGLAKIFVDGTGFGSTIVKMLHENSAAREIVKGFHMAERSTYPDEYENKRAECWGEGRKALISTTDPYSIEADDDGFCIELTCIRKVDNHSGRLQLESKEQLKERGYDSPNRGDAWSLTYAEPVTFYTSQKIEYPKARLSRNMT